MQAIPTEGLSETVSEGLRGAITYFSNHHQLMKSAERRAEKLPIGSGVTEAVCKTLVKMRLCKTGRQVEGTGGCAVLSLCSLVYTEERWQQFWGWC